MSAASPRPTFVPPLGLWLAVVALLCAPLGVQATDLPTDAAATSSPSPERSMLRSPTYMTPLRGPVDAGTYVVGPGDVFGVTVLAPSVDAQTLVVTPEGDLLFPGVGTVRVAGLTLRDAKDEVQRELRRTFRNVTVDVALLQLRRVEVHVTGAVANPGTYVGTAEDVVGTLIDQAGGLESGASRRRIQITRRNGVNRAVDLVRYEQAGDRSANPAVLDGDLVFVPFAKSEISVGGAVELPDRYEWVPGDTIGSLVEIAGGLRSDAAGDSVEFRRKAPEGAVEARVLVWDETARAIELRDGDQVHLRFNRNYEPLASVEVVGEVRFPGPYGIREGRDRLLDVIERAGGFTNVASLDEAALIREAGEEKKDLEFERLAKIPVQDMSEIEYAYFKAKSRERKGLVVLDFRRLAEGDDGQNRLLEDGDRILVPEVRETVTVSGRVTFPGLITYLRGQDARYYVAQAGGFASKADRGGTRVIKGLTGEWVDMGEAGEIVPGDEIWIPERPKRDWWQLAQDTVRFAASIATVYLVIDQATGN